MPDIKIKNQKTWIYTNKVKEHFFNPQNVAYTKEDIEKIKPNAYGEVGSPACGDVMKVWLRIENNRIKKCLWKTFGCASAIASTSIMSVMITKNKGMLISQALKLKPKDICIELGGLPNIKIHCSVLGTQALIKAIQNKDKKIDLSNIN